MRSSRVKTLLIAVLGLASVGMLSAAWDYDSIASQPILPSVNSFDVQQVNRTLLEMVDKWNAHDLDAFLEYFWKSPDLVVVSEAQQFSGWQELHDTYMRGFHNRDEMGRIVQSRIQIRMVRSDLAFALTYWTVNFPTSKRVVVGMDTNYLQRFGNDWKIVTGHSSSAEM
jgi:ketosteroid isomerase-like protein